LGEKIITVCAVGESSDPIVSFAREIPRLERVIAANDHSLFASFDPRVSRSRHVRASYRYAHNTRKGQGLTCITTASQTNYSRYMHNGQMFKCCNIQNADLLQGKEP